MRELLSNKWVKFVTVAILYTLWVIWLGSYIWFLGLAVIFDIYISQKVHWAFWKKKNPPDGRQTKVVEWIDAIIFAVIAASFIRMFFIEAYTIPTSSMEKIVTCWRLFICQQNCLRAKNSEYTAVVSVCSQYHAGNKYQIVSRMDKVALSPAKRIYTY